MAGLTGEVTLAGQALLEDSPEADHADENRARGCRITLHTTL